MPRSIEKAVLEWIRISEYDLETAKAMQDKGRYLYVAFMCQQSIEKILKAVYSYEKKEVPPKTHNLLYLADVLALNWRKNIKFCFLNLINFTLKAATLANKINYPGRLIKNRLKII